MQKVQITSPGIKKALKQYDYPKAIAEYIWNGFDANATQVEIYLYSSGFGNLSKITIADNGHGIPHQELNAKFLPFFESEKELNPTVHQGSSNVHGKNGVGRLTFFQFATQAIWSTTYVYAGQSYSYLITIYGDSLNTYAATEPEITTYEPGTKVVFEGIQKISAYNFDKDIKEYLIREFGWFLELNAAKNYRILINDVPLDYSTIIGEKESHLFKDNGSTFDIRYVRWEVSLNREYSRYYYINSANDEVFKETTTLNQKGDHFYHSVFIKSSYFDMFSTKGVINQAPLIGTLRGDATFKSLIEYVNRVLRNKRKPYLGRYADQLIVEFEENGAFPPFDQNEWDKYRKKELEEVIRELIQVEPKIFSNLNVEQKKTFVGFLNLIIDFGEKDKLLGILQDIVDLEPSEREELAQILKTSKLSNIIKTIKLIEDRYQAIQQLKALVFRPDLKANEPKHIQKFVEKHYWIFGEQYHLVTAAEPDFEEALRRHIYLLKGEKKHVKIDHPDKNKEMDIFMVRQLFQHGVISNVVVELKHPKVHLGEKELSQVKKYMRVILDQDEFNGKNYIWEFHLVGNQFDDQGYMKGEFTSNKSHGEKSLVFSVDNYKIYAKTWSDIFADFELRHKFLYDKLSLERGHLIEESKNADEIIQKAGENSAVQPPEVSIHKTTETVNRP